MESRVSAHKPANAKNNTVFAQCHAFRIQMPVASISTLSEIEIDSESMHLSQTITWSVRLNMRIMTDATVAIHLFCKATNNETARAAHASELNKT